MRPSVLFIILGVLVVLAVIILPLLKAKLSRSTTTRGAVDTKHYALRSVVFSPAERSFLGVLDGSLPDGVSWLGKVRLGDVFITRKGLTPSQRASARNKINQKHVDFLLVRMSDFAPLAGVELDDSSHDAEDRQDRDAFVDQVFRSAGIPLLHIPAQATYSPAALRETVTTALNKNATAVARTG